MMGRTLLLLFGANDPDRGHGGTHQLLAISADIHLIGLALAAAGFAVAVIMFFTARVDRVTQIVAAATAATLAAGIFGTVLPDLAHAHEVAILLPLGAVLAGRMLPPLPSAPSRGRAWLPGRAAAVALGGVARGRAGGAVLRGQPARRRRRPTRDWRTGSSPTTTPTGWRATGSRTPPPSTAAARSWSRPLPTRRPGSGAGNRRPTGTSRATGGRTSSSRWPIRPRPAVITTAAALRCLRPPGPPVPGRPVRGHGVRLQPAHSDRLSRRPGSAPGARRPGRPRPTSPDLASQETPQAAPGLGAACGWLGSGSASRPCTRRAAR